MCAVAAVDDEKEKNFIFFYMKGKFEKNMKDLINSNMYEIKKLINLIISRSHSLRLFSDVSIEKSAVD